mmetsp:Transcript_10912/g.12372  ORF Transcript_10912/g.12372 Transcript_10912/m.12372 type:complete len:106 (-) Transcript_10912:40-357(-)
MLPLYYRDSSAALITYDIGSMRSFEHLEYWANELTQKLTPNTFKIAIVGNKKDISEEDREVPYDVAYHYAKEKGYLFSEVSAKSGDGVNDIFERVANDIIDRMAS